jgi:hypothetical protein
MLSRSLRPTRRPACLWLLTGVLALILALGYASPGQAFMPNDKPLGDTQSSPKGNTDGGDPDGVGLNAPVPPHGSPPFAPEPGNDRRLIPESSNLRLWIELLVEIAI